MINKWCVPLIGHPVTRYWNPIYIKIVKFKNLHLIINDIKKWSYIKIKMRVCTFLMDHELQAWILHISHTHNHTYFYIHTNKGASVKEHISYVMFMMIALAIRPNNFLYVNSNFIVTKLNKVVIITEYAFQYPLGRTES